MSVLRLSQVDGMMPSTVGPTPPIGTQPSLTPKMYKAK